MTTPPSKPSITVVCDNETKTFDSYYKAYSYFYEKASAIDKMQRHERAEQVYKEDPKYVYQVKFVLEEKFGFWVATTKNHKYNVRKNNKPFKFGSDIMFGLTGKELVDFYNRYVKLCILEG